jgi:TolB-like protein/Flp pilus assembly protein TadD
VVFYAFVQPQQEIASDQAPPAQQTGVEKARSAAASITGAISIVVLPFENLSPDPDQEFFSAGMTEEITSALAKIPDLRVVGRTSAFQFKGQNQDLRAIGQALSATHVVEGSVRKAGTRLRITAQLINAENGVSLWTENYDREYADVFAIQEDIATAIAASLRMPLGLRAGERLVNNRTNDLKAYEDYLRVRVIGALALTVPNSVAILEDAVARDPGFAPAWATLALLYTTRSVVLSRQSGSVEEVRLSVRSMLQRAEMAAQKAIQLDSRYAAGHGVLGTVRLREGRWSEAERLYEQALALDPDDPETLQGYGGFLANVGRLKDALQARESLLRLEPFVPLYIFNVAGVMHVNGLNARAAAMLEAIPPNRVNYNRNFLLGAIYATEGQYSKAADQLLLIDTQVSKQAVQDASQLLRTAPTKAQSPDDLPALQADLNFVYAHVGALERVLEFPERVLAIRHFTPTAFIQVWNPLYAPLRKTERFKRLMREAGLVAYWREKGWPDLCRPVGADDFECS